MAVLKTKMLIIHTSSSHVPIIPLPPSNRSQSANQTDINAMRKSRQVVTHKRPISVPNIQSVRIFQYRTFSQYGYSSTKFSVSRDIPVQNIQSIRIFQYKTFSQ
jgi:hypothetical protein